MSQGTTSVVPLRPFLFVIPRGFSPEGSAFFAIPKAGPAEAQLTLPWTTGFEFTRGFC